MEGEVALPWKERVTQLSIHPDAASRDDVARLAAELIEAEYQRDAALAKLAKAEQEIARLRALETKMGSGWALVEYEAVEAKLAETTAERDAALAKLAEQVAVSERMAARLYSAQDTERDNATLRAALVQAREAMRLFEWEQDPDDGDVFCVCCGTNKIHGHDVSCEYGNALAAIDAALGGKP